MIPDYLIQKAIISKLQSDTGIITVLSGTNSTIAQIREEQYFGDNFVYPAIRVHVLDNPPEGNGIDRIKLSRVSFSVSCYSEEPSSFECSKLNSKVIDALFDKQVINGTDENNNPYFNLIRIDYESGNNAFRLDNRIWFALSIFSGTLHKLVSP